MTIEKQQQNTSDVLLSEGNGAISRENRPHNFEPGQIVSDNSGTLEAYKSTEGQEAMGVALGAGVIIARNAEVKQTGLIGLDDAAQTALQNLQIIIR